MITSVVELLGFAMWGVSVGAGVRVRVHGLG